MTADSEEIPRGAAARLEAVLVTIATKAGDEMEATATLGDLFEHLRERAYGLLLLILALPCCLPFVYLLPQIAALPILLLALQMAIGRPAPWLPARLRQREFQVRHMANVLKRSRRYLALAEWFAHPRLAALTGPTGQRIVGAVLLVPAFSILVPLPLTNTVPGIAVAAVAIGLIERDGLFVLGGLLVGLTWVAALVLGGQAALSALIGLITEMLQ